jgi:hypothetical protein
MNHKQANRRFVTVTITSMAVFVSVCLVLARADDVSAVPPPVLWIGSVIPVAALLTPVWAHWRYLNEIDEFLRSIQLKAIFGGLGVLLVLASSWGFVELYIDAPKISMFWLNPLYWIAYSVGAVYFSRREGVEA